MDLFDVNVVDNVAVMNLGNGENRFTAETIQKWHNSLDHILSNRDVEALVTTGSGKFYSNGVDLVRMAEEDRAYFDKFWADFCILVQRIATFPMPTVAAINGHAYAGGAFIVLAHDYRVMNTAKGWFCFNEVHMAIRLPAYLLKFLSLRVPRGKIQVELVAFGRKLTAKEALEEGIVQDVGNGEDEIVAKSLQVARTALGKNGLGREIVREMKEDLFVEVMGKEKGAYLVDKSKL